MRQAREASVVWLALSGVFISQPYFPAVLLHSVNGWKAFIGQTGHVINSSIQVTPRQTSDINIDTGVSWWDLWDTLCRRRRGRGWQSWGLWAGVRGRRRGSLQDGGRGRAAPGLDVREVGDSYTACVWGSGERAVEAHPERTEHTVAPLVVVHRAADGRVAEGAVQDCCGLCGGCYRHYVCIPWNTTATHKHTTTTAYQPQNGP